MLQDLRFTLRLILKERWFSAAAIVALALGIGVNAVGFSIVNAAFLRGLPFENADRLFMLTWQGQPFRSLISHPELRDLNASTRTFVGWGGSRNGTMNISEPQVRATWCAATILVPSVPISRPATENSEPSDTTLPPIGSCCHAAVRFAGWSVDRRFE